MIDVCYYRPPSDVIPVPKSGSMGDYHWDDTPITMPGYFVWRKTRPKHKKAKRYSGGIAICIKQQLRGAAKQIPSRSDDIMWVKLNCKALGGNHDVIVGILYISPSNSNRTKNMTEPVWDILEEELMQFNNNEQILLTGDFNAHTGSLPDYIVNDDELFCPVPDQYMVDSEMYPRMNCDKKICMYGKRLLEVCQKARLRIINGRKIGDSTGNLTCHKYNGSSTVDYFIADVNLFSHVRYMRVHDWTPCLSDHCPVSICLDTFMIYQTPTENVSHKPKAPSKAKWDPIKEHIFQTQLQSSEVKSKIENILTTEIRRNSELEEVLKQVNAILTKAGNVRISYSKKRGKKKTITNKKWFDGDLVQMRKEILSLSKQVTKDHRNEFLRAKLFFLKKLYKRTAIRKKNEYKQNILDNLEMLEKSNPKEYWALFKQLKNNENNMNKEENIPEEKWINHYNKLLGPKNIDKSLMEKMEEKIAELRNEPYFSELDFMISNDEVLKGIQMLKKNKAVGVDHISGEMIISSTQVLLPVYQKLFNSILIGAYYPEVWKKGIVVNLFKTGDPYDTYNYRGLTINSCLGKVFNNIINNRLNKFLVDNNKITKEQIGFKKKARTSDHIFVMNVLLQKYTKLKKKLYLCFVDFKKAYDSVWRRALMLKLLQTGIRGTFFKLIENMYEGGKSSIKMDGLLSKEFTCESGVRQGDVISPNLFNIFINDLPQCLTKGEDTPRIGEKYVNCLMYADDLVVISLSIEDLQNQIDNLNKYCTEWGLLITLINTVPNGASRLINVKQRLW